MMATEKDRECVKVIVRCRPLSQKELNEKHGVIVTVDEQNQTLSVTNPNKKDDVKTFTFDYTFGMNCKQLDVYNKTARPIVDAVLSGYNGTIFAYGQTGSGKSFSMMGVRDNPELRGIIPNSFEHIFSHISHASTNERYLVRASYLEIYNEEIRDLLVAQQKRLELKEHPETGVYVKDLTSYIVKDTSEIDKLLEMGAKNRSVGATLMNAESSRSHSIFSITVEVAEKDPQNPQAEERIRVGKLHLVDLAGSERQAKTGATGDRLKEAAKINLSLTALGNVIASLVDGKSQHIPYRDSKLTRLLQDSLGGNSKTMMIATASPASYNYDETMSTLRYANRTKQIKNKPKINEDAKDTMLREYQEEIQRLKAQLAAMEEGGEAALGVLEDGEDDSEGGESGGSSEGEESRQQGAGTKQKKTKVVVVKKKRGSTNATTNANTTTTQRTAETRQLSDQRLKELQQQIEQERQQLLQSNEMAESEKQATLQALQQREAELEWERQARDALAQKLARMQEKLLVGGENILDQAERHEMELQRQAAELEERKRKERELEQGLEEQEELHFQMEESYSSLQEEAAEKTRKLKTLWTMLMKHKAEMQDLQEEAYREKEQLLETVHDLASELKMKALIVDSFVPQEFQEQMAAHAQYDEEADRWTIAGASEYGIPAQQQRKAQARKRFQKKQRDLKGGYDVDNLFDTLYSNPTILFPDTYLSYNALVEPSEGKVMNGSGVGGKQSRRGSSMGVTGGARPSSKAGHRAAQAASALTQHEMEENRSTEPAMPTARGLVANARRYA